MKPHLFAILQAMFVVFLWATSWVFIKIGLEQIPPIIFAGLRYILAFICLLVLLVLSTARQEIRTLSKRAVGGLFILGLLYYAATQGAIFIALAYLPAVTVNLLWSFSSIFVALLGIVWLSESPTPLQWGGIVVAAIGAMIYFYPVSIPKAAISGFVAAVIGILANAASSTLGRDINRSGKYPALVVTVVSMGVGAIVLLTAGIVTEGIPVISWKGWAIIGWLAVVNTAFAFTLWNHTLRTLTAIESSIINGTMLIWIPIFAVLFLGEKITSKEVLGLVAVGLGTLLVQLHRLQTTRRFVREGQP